MSQATAKATLTEVARKGSSDTTKPKVVEVQFNPESLKLQFSNQISDQSSKAPDQSQGNAGRQFLGKGTTKLSVLLWFDASVPGPDGNRVDDVRRLTQEVVYFITPRETSEGSREWVPPTVCFQWGSIVFEGVVESLEENLEYFSPQGHPLRASIALGLSQQSILTTVYENGAGRSPANWSAPKTDPLTPVSQGQSVQGIAQGAGGAWQAIAQANGVENPRFPQAGTYLDMAAAASRGAWSWR